MINGIWAWPLSIRAILLAVFALGVWSFGWSARAQALEVYLTPKQLLAQFFSTADKVVPSFRELTPEQAQALRAELGDAPAVGTYRFYEAFKGGQLIGRALLDAEVGKSQYFSYGLKFNLDGSLAEVEVLNYRESHGSEIRYDSFLKQFQGLSPSKKPRLGHSVRNISGATLSVRGMVKGTQRGLALYQLFFGAR